MPKPIIRLGTTSRLSLRLPDDGDGLVDVQQDPLQALEQVQPLLFLLHLESRAAAARTPCARRSTRSRISRTAHDPGHAGNQNVEVAGEAVLQRGHA